MVPEQNKGVIRYSWGEEVIKKILPLFVLSFFAKTMERTDKLGSAFGGG